MWIFCLLFGYMVNIYISAIFNKFYFMWDILPFMYNYFTILIFIYFLLFLLFLFIIIYLLLFYLL
jgi:hypothetical protein